MSDFNQHTEPEVLVQAEHITIYYAYTDGDDKTPSDFWYTAVPDGRAEFDVRTLYNWGWNNHRNRLLHADVVREALYHGWLDDYLKRVNIKPIRKDEAQ